MKTKEYIEKIKVLSPKTTTINISACFLIYSYMYVFEFIISLVNQRNRQGYIIHIGIRILLNCFNMLYFCNLSVNSKFPNI